MDKNNIKLFIKLLKPYKPVLPVLVLLFALNSILEVFNIGLLIPAVNMFTATATPDIALLHNINRFFTFLKINSTLFSILLVFLFVSIIKSILGYINVLLYAGLRRDLVFDLSQKIYNNLMAVSYSYFHNTKKGDLLYQIEEAAGFSGQALTHMVNISIQFFLLAGYITLLYLLSPKLLLLSGIVIILLFAVMKPFISRSYKLSEETAVLDKDKNSFFIESIDGIKHIKQFGIERSIKEIFFKKCSLYLDKVYKITRLEGIQEIIKSPLTLITILLCLVFLLKKYLMFPVSVITVYLLILFRLIPGLQQIISEINGLSVSLPQVKMAIDASTAINKPYIKDGTIEIREFKKSIRLENVSFSYNSTSTLVGEGRERGANSPLSKGDKWGCVPDGLSPFTLKNLSLTFEKSKTYLITGPVGAGKTTLIDLIMRIYEPTSGSIYIDDINLKDIKLSSWQNLFAVVPQEPFIFNDTVYNNILFPYPLIKGDQGGCFTSNPPLLKRSILFPLNTGGAGVVDEMGTVPIPERLSSCLFTEVTDIAKQTGAHEFIMRLPEQYDTVLGERGVHLSFGQKHLLSLTRALVKKPHILLLDEATSSVDEETERHIEKALEKLRQNLTVIRICHRLFDKDAVKIYSTGKEANSEKGIQVYLG